MHYETQSEGELAIGAWGILMHCGLLWRGMHYENLNSTWATTETTRSSVIHNRLDPVGAGAIHLK